MINHNIFINISFRGHLSIKLLFKDLNLFNLNYLSSLTFDLREILRKLHNWERLIDVLIDILEGRKTDGNNFAKDLYMNKQSIKVVEQRRNTIDQTSQQETRFVV